MEQRGDIAVKNQLLHTPEGVRDIYNEECERKIILEGRLLSVLKSYGYHPIQTPTFEFFDIFGKEIGTTPSRDLYKFFDREGNTLVLRPDITPSIARCASKYYIEQAIPHPSVLYPAIRSATFQLSGTFKRKHTVRCRIDRGWQCRGRCRDAGTFCTTFKKQPV